MAPSSGARPQTPAPLPRRVYLVRRLVVLAVPVLLVVVLVWWLAGRGDASAAKDGAAPGPTSASASVTPTPARATATQAPSPAPSPTLSDVERAAQAAGVAVCDPAALRVTFEATEASYAGADKPRFTITIATTGDDPCLLEAGDQNRRVTITSGDDVVWSTNHCLGASPESRRLLLGPGVSSKETFTWSRVRSAPGCAAAGGAPGAGTYTARLQLDGEQVGTAVFDLR